MNLNAKLQKGQKIYKCNACGKMTRDTGRDEIEGEICAQCYEEAGWENEHQDYGPKHEDGEGPYPENCPMCAE